MHTYLMKEIEKLRADKLSRERAGSIVMSLNKYLKQLEDSAPPYDDKGYNMWEEKYYEVRHLIEYAEALREAAEGKSSAARAVEDMRTAAADFETIYGSLKGWRIK